MNKPKKLNLDLPKILFCLSESTLNILQFFITHDEYASQDKLFFRIYANINEINAFQVGEYDISEMSIANAINSFNKGNT